MPSLRDLMERRVPHYAAIYLGAGWGLIEFVSFLEERYALAAVWTDLLLLGWVLFIPSILLFAWHHGRPGRDRWVPVEKVMIPLNALVVAFVLGTAFASRTDAATTTVTVTDETGATVERRVARSEFRKRLAIFDFQAAADTGIAWLGTGASSLLASDLSQDIFVDMRVTAHFRRQLLEAGVTPGSAVPVALQRRIAEEQHLPYFLSGSVSRDGAAITVETTLHETASGAVVGRRSVTGTDVLALVDELTPLVKQDLGLPARPGAVKDLPLAELLSSSEAAVRALVEGQTAVLRDDWAAAERHILRATELDPTFAFAHFSLYQVRALSGDAQAALPSLDAAMQHVYRMPERMQFLVKIEHFVMRRDMDRAYAVAGMLTELYPDDVQGLEMRLQIEGFRSDTDGALRTLRRMLELDPQQQDRLLEIGRLEASAGRSEAALEAYTAYAGQFPQDHRAQLRIAAALTSLGRLSEARAALDRALLLEPTSADVLVELARLLRGAGDYDEAQARLQDALAAARTPQDRASVHGEIRAYHETRGEFARAIEAGLLRAAAVAEFQPPGIVAVQRLSLLGLYARIGQSERALALLEEIRAGTRGQLVEVWRIGQLQLAAESRDTAQLQEAIAGVRAIIDDFGVRGLEAPLAHGVAVLHEERGNTAEALRAWERRRELEPGDLGISHEIARLQRQLGRLDDALATVQLHLRSVPAAPLANLEAARIRLLRGDTAEARSHVQRALRAWSGADPGWPPAAEARRLAASLQE